MGTSSRPQLSTGGWRGAGQCAGDGEFTRVGWAMIERIKTWWLPDSRQLLTAPEQTLHANPDVLKRIL